MAGSGMRGALNWAYFSEPGRSPFSYFVDAQNFSFDARWSVHSPTKRLAALRGANS